MMQMAFAVVLVCGALPGEAMYRDAKDAARQGKYADALSQFEACAALEGPLQYYARLGAALSRFRGGDREGGLRLANQFVTEAPYGPWTPLAQFHLAEMYALNDRHQDAFPHFEQSLRSPVNLWWLDDVRWTAAKSAIEHPATAESGYAFFRDLVVTTRFRNPRLEGAALLAQSTDPRNKIAAAGAFLYSGEEKKAQALLTSLQPALSETPALVPEYEAVMGRYNVSTGRVDEGYRMLESLARRMPDAEFAPTVLFYAVRGLAVSGRVAEAEELATRMGGQYPSADDTGEAWWRIADAYAGKGAVADQLRVLDLLATRYPDTGRAPDALSAMGELHRLAGRSVQAVDAYSKLAATFPESALAPEGAFRAGELLNAAGQEKEAHRLFATAADIGLGHYYGHRAQEHLALGGHESAEQARHLKADGAASFIRPIPLEHDEAGEALDDMAGDVRFQRLAFFGAHGYDEAEWEALSLVDTLRQGNDAASAFLAIGEAGVAYSAIQLADALNWGIGEDGKATIDRWRVRYPRAYWKHVRALSRETGVDPYLILSVARQESTYRPALTSHAGASGVMQLMPTTASWLARVDAGIDAKHAANLENPMNSIRLGAYYLQRMIERSNGNLVYALASYNGGPGNCDKWRRRFPTNDMEAFIEQIPFSETKNYVKRVLGFYAAYHSLYPPETLPNPVH